MEKNKFKNDPENYHQMSIPFETRAEADKELELFFEGVSELRSKHKIADILLTVYGSSKTSDGETVNFIGGYFWGNSLNEPVMAAHAFGRTQAEYKEKIAKLISGK